jgi:hypothetical protein
MRMMKMILKMMKMILRIMTVIALSSHSGLAQRWPGRWGPARSYGSLLSSYGRSVPLPEPEPEPEPVRRWSLNQPYSFAFPQPEPEPMPEPLARRKISRRLISSKNQRLRVLPTTTTTPENEPLLTAANILRESSPNPTLVEDNLFDDIFSEESTPSPWAIDTAQLDIVPAVPDQEDDNLEKEEFKDKIVLRMEDIGIPSQFQPVPAVPSDPSNNLARQPKNILGGGNGVVNTVEEEEGVDITEDKNSECLEKCVQQFCIPDKDFSLFSNCVEKCKSFCL